ncbi:hypothetical protein ACC810_10895 [Rhizobium ruizarguesonis]
MIEHVHRLSCWEQVFGPATALKMFGRLHTSIARRPQWLVPGEAKQCFRNATAFALVRHDVTYVEGFALDPALPIPLEHAWLIDDKGQVIDDKGQVIEGTTTLGTSITGCPSKEISSRG